MNNHNSNSNGNSSNSQGLRAELLYTTSPDAVQRMHPHLQLRSSKAYAEAGVYVESRFPCRWFRAPLFIPWQDCQIDAGEPGLFGKFPHLKIVTSKNDLIIYMRGDGVERAKQLRSATKL